MATFKLARVGAGAKTHAGYDATDSGKFHHISLYCDYYPRRPARYIGIAERPEQVTCQKCRAELAKLP